MAKLVVSRDGIIEGHYFLDKARFTIGRNSENDICINNPTISNIHAVILTMRNDHVLEDAGSTNGIVVNREAVTRRILQNNDTIGLSGYELKYVNQRATADMDFDKTMVSHTPLLETHGSHHAELFRPAVVTATPSARFVKTSFPLGGVINLNDANGLSLQQEILISAPLRTFGTPGKQMLMISRRPHGYFITHIIGRKYPCVNGKRIGMHPQLLHENDVIEAGDVRLKFFMHADRKSR